MTYLSKLFAQRLPSSGPRSKVSLPKKATSISLLWPLLRDGQDPKELAARVAYHLHRTHNRTTALTRAGITTDRSYASDLVQGRSPLTESDVRFIADRLALPFSDLVRPLTTEENEAWAFYRTSGRNRLAVWERARAAWRKHGLSDTAAAKAIGLSRAALSNIFTGESLPVMRHDQASKLGGALGSSEFAKQLIAGLEDTTPPR